MALLSSQKQGFFSWLLLTLTHGNIPEFLVLDRNTILQGNSFDLWRRVDSGEQHEEDRSLLVSLFKGIEDAECWLFDVSFTHNL
jgi:hypothetical protein